MVMFEWRGWGKFFCAGGFAGGKRGCVWAISVRSRLLALFGSCCGKQCLHAGLLALIVVPLSGDIPVIRFLQSGFWLE